MELQVLGPLRIVDGGRALPVGGPRPRDLLAFLSIRRGEFVPASRLVDVVWGASAGPGVLHTAVSRLRKTLGPGCLVRSETGYSLGPDVHLDCERFARLTAEGAAARTAGRPDVAAERISAALDLWRGEAYLDVPDEIAGAERLRLDEARTSALEERIAADIDRLRHAEVVGELRTLLAEHPLRERLHALLITALYRSGRQADALNAYRELRLLLGEELGLDPSPELVDLQQRVLAQDESLAAPAPTGFRTRVPHALTATRGREADLAAVAELMATYRLVTVTGPGGVGKTRMLLEVGAAAEARGEQVVYVDLSGATVEDVPDAIARALEVPQIYDDPEEALAERIGRAPLRLLVDNVEHVLGSAGLLAALLRRCHRLLVVAGSRQRLRVMGEAEYALAPLEVPAPGSAAHEVLRSPAVVLLLDRLADSDPTFRTTGGTAGTGGAPGRAREAAAAALAEVCRRLDGLPLALELVAAQGRMLSPAQLLARLEDPLELRDPTSVDRPDRHRSLAETIAWSVSLLAPGDRAVLARASVFAGGADLEAAAAVCAPGLAREAAEAVLLRLVDRSLLRIERTADGEARLRMFETIRAYARGLLDASGRGDAEHCHRQHYAARWSAQEWVDDELLTSVRKDYDNALAGLRSALTAAGPAPEAYPLAVALGLYWLWSEAVHTGLAVLEEVLHRSHDAEGLEVAKVRVIQAALLRLRGRADAARATTDQALPALRASGDPAWLTNAYAVLMCLDHDAGRFAAAVRWGRLAADEAAQCGDERFADALANLSVAAAAAGLPEAVDWAEHAIALAQRSASTSVRLPPLCNACIALVESGRAARGREVLEREARNDELRRFAVVPQVFAINLGWAAVAEQDWEEALGCFDTFLSGPEADEQALWTVEALCGEACALAGLSRMEPAALLLAGAVRLAGDIGARHTPWRAARIDEAVRRCAGAGEAWARGERLAVAELVTLARSFADHVRMPVQGRARG
ncbi:AfsR/SARP family transcriptional regulator [Motilibacter deserti]|uniref:AfsR/SARP family transcriptional regulator n=1 Tax=Motilibacter deserti TaxID=2714956 RepID=A0ABX0GT45_9ACTN|nr:AfsR/SARP family transcriptional regulator [Motilibacter deserti]NHC14083.1 AfsR/SARP family transcriptional regulator [Motilibacter deserti]